MSAVAAYPQIIKNAVLTPQKNTATIYGARFFIRGRPWVIAVDDYIYMQNAVGGTGADPDPSNNNHLIA